MSKSKPIKIDLSELRINVENVEIYEKVVSQNSNNAGKVYVPKEWVGKRVLVMVIK
ncbi:MAG: DUF2080 family transposase-associated protein [Thermoplasmatales archaeon]|nr:DUF2080 family transposase-associated protein [Thermoplasmatales archaeon]